MALTKATVRLGGTGATSPSITAFNNITGFSAAGTTGTTSTNLVFSTSPSLITPNIGTPSAGTLTNCSGLPDSGLSLTDVTTNNVSTSKHGFAPKLPNDATKYLDGTGSYSIPPTSFSSGQIVGSAFTQSSAVAQSSGTAFYDDTIPQLSECPVLTAFNTSYTGTSGNKLRFTALLNMSANVTANYYIVSLFIDSNTSASAAEAWKPDNNTADCIMPAIIQFELTLSDSSAHTYKIGVGGVSGDVCTINGQDGGRKLGGVLYSSLKIEEIKA